MLHFWPPIHFICRHALCHTVTHFPSYADLSKHDTQSVINRTRNGKYSVHRTLPHIAAHLCTCSLQLPAHLIACCRGWKVYVAGLTVGVQENANLAVLSHQPCGMCTC